MLKPAKNLGHMIPKIAKIWLKIATSGHSVAACCCLLHDLILLVLAKPIFLYDMQNFVCGFDMSNAG